MIDEKTATELKTLVGNTWEEFKLLQEDTEVELKMDPVEDKKSLCFGRLLGSSGPTKLKIAFVYERTAESSA